MRDVKGGGHTLARAEPEQQEVAAHGPDAQVVDGPGLVSDATQQKQKQGEEGSKAQNADEPASSSSASNACPASDANNPYRSRPLPIPPLRPKTPTATTAMDRPSTSGGPSASKGYKPDFSQFGKRMSRDDFNIGITSEARNQKTYRIPMRGRLPTPDASPRSRSPVGATVQVRTTTPDSFDGSRQRTDGALSNWQPQTQQYQDSYRDTPEPTLQRKKSGRWRLFRFGSKKSSDSNSNRSTPELVAVPAMPTWVDPTPMPQPNYNNGMEWNAPEKRSKPRQPAAPVRSQTEPYYTESPNTEFMMEPKTPRSLARKTSNRSLKAEVPKIKKSDISAPVPMPAMPAAPPPNFLDVEIPSIKLERYSVMFSGLLGPQSSSSLLARRQATLDKLKTINDAIVKEEEEKILKQRRATSPHVAKSPSFSLFPNTPSRQASLPVHRLSPLARSNTSPAALHSPLRATFVQAQAQAQVQTQAPAEQLASKPQRPQRPAQLTVPATSYIAPAPQEIPRAAEPPKLTPEQQRRANVVIPRILPRDFSKPREIPAESEVPRPRPIKAEPFNFSNDSSALILDSPTEMETEEGEVIIQLDERLKPNLPEPSWQMVSPPASTPSSTTSSSGRNNKLRSSPSSVSSVQTHITKPSIDEADPTLKSAIEISIARQISLSRQQRQLLQPLKTNFARPLVVSREPSPSTGSAGGSKNASPAAGRRLNKNERLAEIASATPTVVNPASSLYPQNRKSEKIIIEGSY